MIFLYIKLTNKKKGFIWKLLLLSLKNLQTYSRRQVLKLMTIRTVVSISLLCLVILILGRPSLMRFLPFHLIIPNWRCCSWMLWLTQMVHLVQLLSSFLSQKLALWSRIRHRICILMDFPIFVPRSGNLCLYWVSRYFTYSFFIKKIP